MAIGDIWLAGSTPDGIYRSQDGARRGRAHLLAQRTDNRYGCGRRCAQRRHLAGWSSPPTASTVRRTVARRGARSSPRPADRHSLRALPSMRATATSGWLEPPRRHLPVAGRGRDVGRAHLSAQRTDVRYGCGRRCAQRRHLAGWSHPRRHLPVAGQWRDVGRAHLSAQRTDSRYGRGRRCAQRRHLAGWNRPDGIYRSQDGGATWGALISPPSGQTFVRASGWKILHPTPPPPP